MPQATLKRIWSQNSFIILTIEITINVKINLEWNFICHLKNSEKKYKSLSKLDFPLEITVLL